MPHSKLEKADDLSLLTALVYGEARSQKIDGKIAVAFCAKHRKDDPKRWPDTWAGVILQPKQFSCFNEDDKNFDGVLRALDTYQSAHDIAWRECKAAAFLVLHGWHRDNIYGCNHYHAIWMNRVPYWASDRVPLITIGEHRFYRL